MQFRNEISDIETAGTFTDLQCLAWLRARELDVPKASEMLRKCLAWRKEEDFDSILEWEPPPHYLSEYPYEIVGEDYEGHPGM